jgi:flagellar hook-length control protein FliK
MKSDAMASSFFTRIQVQAGRMDRALGKDQSFLAQGFGSAKNGTNEDDNGFKAVYSRVAKMNAQALQSSDASLSSKSTPKAHFDEMEAMQDHHSHANAQPPEVSSKVAASSDDSAATPVDPTDPNVLAAQALQLPAELQAILANNSAGDQAAVDPASSEASAIISQALQVLSDALHITVDPDLKQLSISKVSKDTVQQLSEILFALKKIGGLLDEAVANNQKLDTGTAIIDVPEAQQLSTLVHTQMFRIELGVSMLGIADQVSGEVAQKLAIPFSGNIPQAVDPAQMSMPQASKMFEGLLADSTKDLAALAEKIRELCAKNLQGQNTQPAMNFAVRAAATATQSTVATNSGVSPFDAQTMRKILKIDGKQLTAGENAEAAARSEKLDLPAGAVKELAKNLTIDAVKSAGELLPVGDATAKAAAVELATVFEAKPANSSSRVLDESVMKQITEKMNSAVVRSGVTELRIQMRPESLGEVKLRIRIEGDVVFARIQVENPQVKQIVESNMQQLKDSLAQQNLQTGSLEVHVGNDGGRGSDDGEVRGESSAESRMTVEAVGANGSADSDALSMALGAETGRRFGENTIEYFA